VKLQLECVRDITCNENKETAKKKKKKAKRFWARRLFNDAIRHGHKLLCELPTKDGSGLRNFVRMTKSDFEILLRKLAPESKGKIQSIVKQFLPQSEQPYRSDIWPGVIFLNFESDDLLFGNKINCIAFLLQF
jgi:hypothetical protein